MNPLTGQVTATASGSAVDGSAGLYAVRDGVALGLDQGASGDAWGYDISAQRVTLTAAGLGWPHYFVDLSGIGGSADPASDLVVIAACTQLAPSSPVSASPVRDRHRPATPPQPAPSADCQRQPSARPRRRRPPHRPPPGHPRRPAARRAPASARHPRRRPVRAACAPNWSP